MMNLISNVHNEYNENILSDNFNFTNGVIWNDPSGATIDETSVNGFDNRAIRIQAATYADNGIQASPVNPEDLAFEVPKSGKYIFSFKVVLPIILGEQVDITGSFFWDKNLTLTTIECPFQIGNNTVPEFTFQYEKMQTFYQEMDLLAGDTYTLRFDVDDNPTWMSNILDITFTAFKMEYVEDKPYNVPTIYTKPSRSSAGNTSYLEVSSMTFIEPYHNTIIVTANSFNVVLPPAIPHKGKIIEVVNKGAGTTTLMGYGIDTIDGSASLNILTLTGVRVISDGVAWKVLSITNN